VGRARVLVCLSCFVLAAIGSGIALAPVPSTAQALVTKALAFGRPFRAPPEQALQSCVEERQTLGDDAHVDPVRCALPRADDKTATTTPTPGTGGTTQPSTGGTTQPSTGGTPSPDTGGTAQPSTGTTQPSTGGATLPSTGTTTQPSTGGTTQPSTGATPSPDTGTSQPATADKSQPGTGATSQPSASGNPPALSVAFAYYPPGVLDPHDATRGRKGDRKVYLPNIIFPLRLAPDQHPHLNSQIWGHGGGGWDGKGEAGGAECDPINYDALHQHDTYCEVRSWSMPMCPGGQGHQGQDIRPPTCKNNKWEAVAVADGIITLVTANTTVRLRGADGTEYWYLHMHPQSITVKQGDKVQQGDVLGRVSSYMDKDPNGTTTHLHFQVRQTIRVDGKILSVYVPGYTSLIASYRKAKGLDPGIDSDGNLIVDAEHEIGAPKPPAPPSPSPPSQTSDQQPTSAPQPPAPSPSTSDQGAPSVPAPATPPTTPSDQPASNAGPGSQQPAPSTSDQSAPAAQPPAPPADQPASSQPSSSPASQPPASTPSTPPQPPTPGTTTPATPAPSDQPASSPPSPAPQTPAATPPGPTADQTAPAPPTGQPPASSPPASPQPPVTQAPAPQLPWWQRAWNSAKDWWNKSGK